MPHVKKLYDCRLKEYERRVLRGKNFEHEKKKFTEKKNLHVSVTQFYMGYYSNENQLGRAQHTQQKVKCVKILSSDIGKKVEHFHR